jgi:hypothetical protein
MRAGWDVQNGESERSSAPTSSHLLMEACKRETFLAESQCSGEVTSWVFRLSDIMQIISHSIARNARVAARHNFQTESVPSLAPCVTQPTAKSSLGWFLEYASDKFSAHFERNRTYIYVSIVGKHASCKLSNTVSAFGTKFEIVSLQL